MNGENIITAFLDASVLYPALLRDILMRLASHQVFKARWSAKVQSEWVTALARNRPDIPAPRIARTRELMDTHFPNARVEGYEHLIDILVLPDADDRHVLAAALHCRAEFIVTTNLRDFPASDLASFSVRAIHPDAFIFMLLDDNQTAVLHAIRKLRSSLKNPTKTQADLLAAMQAHGLLASAEALNEFLDHL
jgi:hypothetical protein